MAHSSIQETTNKDVKQVQGLPKNEPQDINNDQAAPQPGGSLPKTEVEECQTSVTPTETTRQPSEINDAAEMRKDYVVIPQICSILRLE